MIVDHINTNNWNITIIYEATCDDIDFIIETLKDIKCPIQYIDRALDNLENCKLNTGLTYSNLNLKSSVIIINKTSSVYQLINTISHEYYHLIRHISKVLDMDEEELAHLNGNLNMYSYKTVSNIFKEVGSE